MAQTPRRIVNCHVESAGTVKVNGKCLFTREKGGSFTLENVDRDKPLVGEIMVLNVSIESPGNSEVQKGLTSRGNNSR